MAYLKPSVAITVRLSLGRSAVLFGRLSAWWVALGINLERSRPGKPQDNGAHERLQRDISQELE